MNYPKLYNSPETVTIIHIEQFRCCGCGGGAGGHRCKRCGGKTAGSLTICPHCHEPFAEYINTKETK